MFKKSKPPVVRTVETKIGPKSIKPTAKNHLRANVQSFVTASSRASSKSSLEAVRAHKRKGTISDAVRSKKRVRIHKPRAEDRIQFDNESDDNGDSTPFELAPTPVRHQVINVDESRRLWPKRFESSMDGLIHAAETANLALGHVPALGATAEQVGIKLRYPGSHKRERYELVYPKEKQGWDPVLEIIDVAKSFAKFFLDGEDNDALNNPDTGIIRRLERANNLKHMADFKAAIESYNEEVRRLVEQGVTRRTLSTTHTVPLDFVNFVMEQVMARAVSPQIDLVRKYENGSDDVYGEIKPRLLYEMLVETGLRSNHVFIDLGSGVGNCVVQAALQVGCESWGCEKMPNACKLAVKQKAEFEKRCRLWGINIGAIHLEENSFLENEAIKAVLPRADVILVNNEVFSPELNNSLTHMFLDVKEGCQIVSLKSFATSQKYNDNDVANSILKVDAREFGENSVSWKSGSGRWYISTRRGKSDQ